MRTTPEPCVVSIHGSERHQSRVSTQSTLFWNDKFTSDILWERAIRRALISVPPVHTSWRLHYSRGAAGITILSWIVTEALNTESLTMDSKETKANNDGRHDCFIDQNKFIRWMEIARSKVLHPFPWHRYFFRFCSTEISGRKAADRSDMECCQKHAIIRYALSINNLLLCMFIFIIFSFSTKHVRETNNLWKLRVCLEAGKNAIDFS